MEPCPEIDQVALMLAGELPPEQQARLARHLQQCPACWAYLARVRRLAEALPGLAALSTGTPTSHPGDLELAAYAAGGRARQRAERLETHLADCDECAHVLTAARRGLATVEDLLGDAGEGAPERARGWPAVMRGLTTWRGRALLVGVGAATLLECAALALPLAQTLVLLLQEPPGWDTLLELWPFTALPAGPWRMAAYVVVSLGVAGLSRLVWRRLYRAAVQPPGPFTERN
jgi:anti-sigma factor RsiW